MHFESLTVSNLARGDKKVMLNIAKHEFFFSSHKC